MRDWLAVRAQSTPKADALRAAGPLETDLSYADLDDRVETLAGRLAGAEVCVGDAVAVCADVRPEFVTLVHAAQRIGGVLVPINTTLQSDEIHHRLDRIDPEVVICERETEALVRGVPNPILSFDEPTAEADETEALSNRDPQPYDLPEWELGEPLAVLFTSGTTGTPNGVVLTIGNVLANATASAFRLGLRAHDCWHVPLPMYHMGGLAPVYRSILYGTALSLQRESGLEPLLNCLETANATGASMVPTQLERLLNANEPPELRQVLVGGAPCPPALLKRAQRRDVPVAPTYGMTEAASQIATARPSESRSAPESVGHPLMFAEVTILDDAGQPCATGETGEIVVSGPMVTPGYLNESVTKERFHAKGLRTGDRGYRDDAGRLYVEGRVDDMILSGGENVYPGEVAAVLDEHPSVKESAVVGIDDPAWGERVAALVVSDESSLSRDDLEAHCRTRLADFKVPKTIEFADRLPRTASGTIDREAVVDRLQDS